MEVVGIKGGGGSLQLLISRGDGGGAVMTIDVEEGGGAVDVKRGGCGHYSRRCEWGWGVSPSVLRERWGTHQVAGRCCCHVLMGVNKWQRW